MHELPKILGTITLFRSLGLSINKTIIYGITAQIGSPVAAMFVYILGKKIDHDQFQALEIASISSLASIVIWIIYLKYIFILNTNTLITIIKINTNKKIYFATTLT